MKTISSIALFAALPLLAGCPPREQVTGRVLSLAGPVADAGVLGMIWIEDTDKAKPAPVIDGLGAKERDAVYDKDVAERGLPVAYARAFTDEKGWFTLDGFQFSRETKKAVKAMKQPRITRVTLCAFQRGYLKRALTAFPKDETELPYAVLMLFKPRNWKDMAGDSSFSSLERPEFYNGYSKEFGATAKEKAWFFEYTHSNLYQAYEESDIKGEKEWEAYCGHDYSDVLVSTAGMQRNSEREKCGELLKRISAIRKNEKIWGDHWLYTGEWAQTARILVSEAIAGLGTETGEPREYAREILEGVSAAGERLGAAKTINLLDDSKLRLEEAKLFYGRGNKAAAYAALGQALYARIRAVPEDVQITKIIIASQDALTGFYKLMNRPLTAERPSATNIQDVADASTKKDAQESLSDVTGQSVNTKEILDIGGDKIRLKSLYGSLEGIILENREVEVKDNVGQSEKKLIERRAFANPGADYVLRSHSVLSGWEGDDNVGNFEKSVYELFDTKGNKLFEKELGNRNFKQAWIFNNGTSVLYTNENPSLGVDISRYQIYDSSGNLLNEIINTAEMPEQRIKWLKITNGINIAKFTLSPEADVGLFNAAAGGIHTVHLPGAMRKIIKLDMAGRLSEIGSYEAENVMIDFSKGSKVFLVFSDKPTNKLAPSGQKYREQTISFYKDFKHVWDKSIEIESFIESEHYSKTDKYLILGYWKDIIMKGNVYSKFTECVKVFSLSTGKIVYDGNKADKKVKEYAEESIAE